MLSHQKCCCLASASSVLDRQKQCCPESGELDEGHDPTPGINAIIILCSPDPAPRQLWDMPSWPF